MRIVLIGFMGSGKSSVGELLSTKYALPWYELDAITLQLSVADSVDSIFSERGEAHFRTLESQACHSLYGLPGIISSGGGVVENSTSMNSLASNCDAVVYLYARFETILARLSGCKDRPLFKDEVAAQALYARRQALYEKYSDVIVRTDSLSVPEVCDRIYNQLLSSIKPEVVRELQRQ